MTSPTASSTAPATTGRTACFRHPRHVWIASCPDCTAWYLAGLRAAPRNRDRAASAV
ncbi:hypothetical protein JD79_03181 [Geodermatophilus normandii]|uniref:Uncharacterized protein n=1 Tax=Geodermatophilus normandii TaxID=1137989 RepID=A0A317QM59_9ACTN|nr:hypothetical protein [Geodermatophilus normandii]PWW24004.1 hypothetical protein JD79_03181 [Geodermatophilus normandii]